MQVVEDCGKMYGVANSSWAELALLGNEEQRTSALIMELIASMRGKKSGFLAVVVARMKGSVAEGGSGFG